MSAASSCDCNCPTPELVNTPGPAGENGADGAAGTAGVSAFSTLTSDLTLPAVNANVTALVTSSAMFAIGQKVFSGDGTDEGTFSVVSLPSAASVELQFLGYADDSAPGAIIASGSKVVPAGTQPTIPSPTTVANGGTNSATATAARAALGVGGASLTVYAAGTAYQLTNTAALLNFGTTDPSLTITSAGVWLILARARIDYTGATFAAVRTGTLKLRRTNNTAAIFACGTGRIYQLWRGAIAIT